MPSIYAARVKLDMEEKHARQTYTVCGACLDYHRKGRTCAALKDSENDCECLCSSEAPRIGQRPWFTKRHG